jgi:uncharacterized protein (TIGR02145 family)
MKLIFRISRIILVILSIIFLNSCEEKPTPPVITTTAVSTISYTTATSGGAVTNEGGAAVTAKGVCWNTSPDPTISNNKTSDGTGTGSFSSSLTGLTTGTAYYVRAYATNIAGTGYGNQVTFTTIQVAAPVLTTTVISSITQTTAVSGGNITADNGSAITVRGVCWGTDVNPTTSNNKTSDATGTGIFTSTLTGLIGNTTYYVRAYATNSAGTEYGNQVNFKTSPLMPSLSTAIISSITQTSAASGGNVTSDGGATVTARGICWSTSANPTIALSTKTSDGSGTGIFTSLITGLTHSTTYYVLAYATNSVGTAYGNQMIFTTSPIALAALTTTTITTITQTTAVSGGNITTDNGSSVTARGVCWGTATNPTTANNKTTDGTGTGAFTSLIIGLTTNTTYYVRAYATNNIGTEYGNEITFTLWMNQSGLQVSDIDGNIYNSVKIGNQVWMTENLKTTKYNDGITIPLVADNTAWTALITSGYCWYNNDATTYKNTYGAIYNWNTVKTGKLCPTGWHVPTDTEWHTLILYLDPGAVFATIESVTSGKLKESGTTHWQSPNTGATNESGFTALPGGDRDVPGPFYDIRLGGYWWSSTEEGGNAWYRHMYYLNSNVFRSYCDKRAGFSVRCLKDN